jgi:hypothetical protein
MTPFQIVAILVLAGVCGLTIRSIGRKRLTPLAGVFWLLVWLSGAIAIAWPTVTVEVAQLLGIKRGADLVSYLSVLAMLFGLFAVNVKIRRLESQITFLVRELALRNSDQAIRADE